MTQKLLVTLVEAKDGSVYIIRNKNRLARKKPEETENLKELEEIAQGIRDKKEEKEPDSLDANFCVAGDVAFDESTNRIEPVKSMIIKAPNLLSVISYGLNKTDRNFLNIPKPQKMKLKKEEQEALKGIVAIDFIDHTSSPESTLRLWNAYLVERHEDTYGKARLIDLSGNFTITEKTLEESDPTAVQCIREIVFSQNVQLQSFDWLQKFQNLKILSFWYCYQIQNETIARICKLCSNLTSMNIHNCFNINNRVLVPLLQMKAINKICLDNHLMFCQTNVYQGLITNKEWQVINNHTLEYLFINSDNLTNDVIDHILKACHTLKKLLVNTLVLKRLHKNLEEGIGPDQITFQSSDDLRVGFKAKKDIKIKNLLKDRYEEPFSESMKQVIDDLRDYDSAYEESDKEGDEGEVNERKTKTKVDPKELLEKELLDEVKAELREKLGEDFEI